jgi:hypothetical protein
MNRIPEMGKPDLVLILSILSKQRQRRQGGFHVTGGYSHGVLYGNNRAALFGGITTAAFF